VVSSFCVAPNPEHAQWDGDDQAGGRRETNRSASGQGEEDEGNDEFVLRLGLDLALGVEGEVLAGGRVGSGEGCLGVLRSSAGKDELAEVEVECSGAAESAGRLGLGDRSDHRGTLWDRDGVVRVVDGFGDGGFDLLARFGGGGA
jgi:hypothetical protein